MKKMRANPKPSPLEIKTVVVYLLKIMLLAVAYHLAARLGLKMAYVQVNTSPVWPPTGIALAALLLFGHNLWPGITLGVLLGSLPPGAPLAVTLGIALGNTLEALVGAYCLERLVAFHNTIDDAVCLAIAKAGGQAPTPPALPSAEEHEWLAREKGAWSPQQKYLRGLFAGGTFCHQSQQILAEAGITVYSNAPHDPKNQLPDPDHSRGHTVVDMGDDYYTLGRPHPMIDGTMRRQRILTEGRDPQVAVLLLDVILGYNAAKDPVGELLDAIAAVKQAAQKRGGHLTVVASICGTEGDPQDLHLQTRLLREAGAIVFHSSGRAAAFCSELLKNR